MGGVIVVGGGDFARVIIEALRSRHITVLGFVDPQPRQETVERLNVVRLGDDSLLTRPEFAEAGLALGVVGIGLSPVRRKIVERVSPSPQRWVTVTHAAAWVSPTATIEHGAVILAGAVVNSGARLGAHAIVNIGAMLDHDVSVGSFCHVTPSAALGGSAVVGDDSYLGIGCRIRDHVALGRRTLVGMGAVVTKSFPDDARLIGVPAKEMPPTSSP